jgi:hypothetical protein
MRRPSVLKREAGRTHEGTGAISFALEESDAAHLVRSPSPCGEGEGVTGPHKGEGDDRAGGPGVRSKVVNS